MKLEKIAEEFQKLDPVSQALHIALMPWYKRYWLTVRFQIAVWWLNFRFNINFLKHPIALLRLVRSYIFLGFTNLLLVLVKFYLRFQKEEK